MTLRTLSLAAAIAAATACAADDAPAIVGDWESTLLVAGQHNELSIDDELGGHVRLYFYQDDQPYYTDYTAWAERTADDAAFVLHFRCDDGNCPSYSVVSDCRIQAGGDEMSCTADGVWSEYAFQWRLR